MASDSAKPQRKGGRIDLLDAYRTIAIAWVAVFHYGYFWSSAGYGDNVLPYDDALAWIPLSSVGFLGVTLFFLISGFVISLTLQTTKRFSDFVVKRFARLWPTLLICGAITFLSMKLFGPPELQRSISEALISMTLIPPQHVGLLTGNTEWAWLDGAYWSLWVEVRFYIIIGALYYLFPKRWLEAWLVYECVTIAASAALLLQPTAAISMLDGLLFSVHVPFFTLGILACRYKKEQTSSTDLVALAVAGGHVVFNLFNPNATLALTPALVIGYAVVFGLFVVFVWRPNVLSWMEQKLVLKIGRASYSFYLLHQVAGISVLYLIANLFGSTASLISLPFVVAALIFLSIQIFDHVEQPANRWIVTKYMDRFGATPVAQV